MHIVIKFFDANTRTAQLTETSVHQTVELRTVMRMQRCVAANAAVAAAIRAAVVVGRQMIIVVDAVAAGAVHVAANVMMVVHCVRAVGQMLQHIVRILQRIRQLQVDVASVRTDVRITLNWVEENNAKIRISQSARTSNRPHRTHSVCRHRGGCAFFDAPANSGTTPA